MADDLSILQEGGHKTETPWTFTNLLFQQALLFRIRETLISNIGSSAQFEMVLYAKRQTLPPNISC